MKFNNIEAPCQNCNAREIGCHSNCDVYLAYRDRVDEYNAERLKKAEQKASNRRYRENKLIKLRKVVGQR